jgi:hypothetical protein
MIPEYGLSKSIAFMKQFKKYSEHEDTIFGKKEPDFNYEEIVEIVDQEE